MADMLHSGTRLHGLVLRICTAWAVLGGFVLLAVIIVNVASVVGAATINKASPALTDPALTQRSNTGTSSP